MSEFLQVAIDRYGGRDLWQALTSVTLQIDHLGGPLPFLKGLGRTFVKPSTVEILPHQRRAEFRDYPRPGCVGIFNDGRVHIVDPAHLVHPAPSDHRITFRGLRKNRRWSALDALYFFGYALVTYHSIPFILADLPRTETRHKNGFIIDVKFPPSYHTHCARQKFHFNHDGLLLRHDYTADIVGTWARGAHLTSDYQTLQGFPVARKPRVFARLSPIVTLLPVLQANLRPLDVRMGESSRTQNLSATPQMTGKI